jgi:glycosyltransferase involved in cell wall biosynthesis
MNSPAISAVICTYDRYDLLPKAIESLKAQTLPAAQFQIIVVDNSPDHARSDEFAERYCAIPNLTWVIEKRPGLSNARNVGTERAASPVVAFMDDDAIATPTWLETLVAAFGNFGSAAEAAGGRVMPIWGSPRPAWLPDELLGYVSVVDWGGTTRAAGPREWVAGTNIAFRKEALERAGGFSVGLGRNKGGHALLSNDEIEIIARLRGTGGQLLYVPDAVVEHLVPADRLTQSWFRRRVAWQAVSDYLQDPKGLFERAPRYWREVTDFYSRLPPRHRTPRGLYVEQREAEMFRRQLSALYNFTVATLAGFNGLEGGEA